MNKGKNLKLGIPREVLYERVIDGLSEGVLLINLDSRTIEDANPAIAELLGYTVDELSTLKIYDIVAHPHEQVDDTVRQTLETGQHLLPRRRLRRKDGKVVRVEVSVSRVDISDRRAAFAVIRDLSEKIAFEHRLQNLLLYDAMTGLPTSTALRDHAEHAIVRAKQSRTKLAYIVLDLNKFSAINERFGLTMGDQVIVHVGHRLSAALKGCDFLGRLQGGDEFGVLFTADEGIASVRSVVDRILNALDNAIVLDDGTKVSVAPSIGAALLPDHGSTFDELAHHAGIAMKRARTERVQYVLYDTSYEPFGDFGFDIAVELPRAINDGRLSLLYQPVVQSAALTHCVGAEALVRWNHEHVGSVPPGYFVPAAEEANVVHHLDKWVIESVIKQIAAWQKSFPEKWVSANVSAHTLGTTGIVEWLTSRLDAHGVPATRLMLEVTETAAMMNRDTVVTVLENLRATGIRIALDDFGTGYSSLAYLKHIPVDIVKIDREFVTGIGADARDEHTVRTIVGLLRGIKCSLLAEGVETKDQCEWLKAIGIEMIQGYWIARPQPAENMSAYFGTAGAAWHLSEDAAQAFGND